jgi:hypothetical protein
MYDSTEVAIQRMIEAMQRMISLNYNRNSEGEGEAATGRTAAIIITNAATKRHFELQIKTLLQKAPRDADKLKRLLKIKERENEKARKIEDTIRLVTEIEMLKLVLYLVRRGSSERRS